MTIPYVALLYSITLGARGRVRMADWREMMALLGLQNPRTLIATGNAVFESEIASSRQLETLLEDAFASAFGRRVDTIVRTAERWRRLVGGNPFVEESRLEGDRVAVRVMREPLGRDVTAMLSPYATQGERLDIVDGDLWIHFGDRPAQSRLLPVLTAKRLGVGTLRNWNTVRRIDEMLDGPSPLT